MSAWILRAPSSPRCRRQRCSPGRASTSARSPGCSLTGADLAGKTLRTCLVQRSALTEGRPAQHDVRRRPRSRTAICRPRSSTGATFTDVTFRRCKLLGVDWSSTRRGRSSAQPLRVRELPARLRRLPEARTCAAACSATAARARSTSISAAPICVRRRSPARTSSARASGERRLVDADLVSGAYAYDLDPRENDVRGLRVARCPRARPAARTSGSWWS